VRKRLGTDTIRWIGLALQREWIVERDGHYFDIKGQREGKGPYKWFSRRSTAGNPACNWEYFVQVAYFARLQVPCERARLTLALEDGLMDISVRRGQDLIWCIEVKEKKAQLDQLLKGIKRHGAEGVTTQGPDRGKDPLRKAKYLMRHRPLSFSGVAIGAEYHYRVAYESERTFSLVEAKPPVEPATHIAQT
jgi:hypothetical protein